MRHTSSKIASNKFYRHSRIGDENFLLLVRYFALDLTASEAALRTGLTRKTVTTIFLKLRRRLARECERQSPFAQSKQSGNGSGGGNGRGRAAAANNIVFGILEQGGSIYTELVPESERPTLRAVIRGHIAPEAVTRSEDWRGYVALVDVGWPKHFLVERGQNGSAPEGAHAGEVESFWSFSQRRLRKFNGIPPRTFYLHLKECEWRFNNQSKETYQELLRLLRERPL